MSDFSFSTPAPSTTQSLNGLGKRFRSPASALGNVVAGVWTTYCSSLRRSDALQGLSRNKRPTPGQVIRTNLARCKQTPQQLPLANKMRRVHGVARGRIMQTLARLRFLLLAFRFASRFSLSAIARNRRPCFRGRTAALPGQLQPYRPCTSQAPGCRTS